VAIPKSPAPMLAQAIEFIGSKISICPIPKPCGYGMLASRLMRR
jgi:hypothetical protein